MKTSVMISQDLLNQVGLPEVLQSCHCRTSQGKRLKNSTRFFTNESRDDFLEEITAIARLVEMIKAKHSQVLEAQTQLSRLRELRGTFSRLEKGSLLDDTEFFELKGALTIFFRISRLKELMAAAGLHFQVTKDASTLLDPAGTGNPTFHIYSHYSPDLAGIRGRKRKLERDISEAKGNQRKVLLTQRTLVTAEEDKLEEQIRRQLGEKLKEWLPQMRHNAETCAILDFRLAKADLAVRWNATQPVAVDPSEPAILVDSRHPLIAGILQKRGMQFTPISITLKQGSTVLSGPNMGGKSVALKTIFLALLMTQLGYFPICEHLETPLYDFMAFESHQEGDLHWGLSSFGLECVQIRNHHRRSQKQQGLIMMDEPCRGTNPAEATAIVQALCKTYGKSSSTFFIATHYNVTPAAGIRFYQVRGIRPEVLAELPVPQASGQSELHEDLNRVRKIQNLMDYRFEEIEGPHQTPSGAIKIAELLGVDQVLLEEMIAAWQEDQWPNLD